MLDVYWVLARPVRWDRDPADRRWRASGIIALLTVSIYEYGRLAKNAVFVLRPGEELHHTPKLLLMSVGVLLLLLNHYVLFRKEVVVAHEAELCALDTGDRKRRAWIAAGIVVTSVALTAMLLVVMRQRVLSLGHQ